MAVIGEAFEPELLQAGLGRTRGFLRLPAVWNSPSVSHQVRLMECIATPSEPCIS